MQLSTIIPLAAFAIAAPTTDCKPTKPAAVAPTLPSTGSTDLPTPSSDLTLLYIAVGHGIQNYTCASDNATAVNIGALAVFYDATALYPSSGSASALSTADWDDLTSSVLWDTSIPLNLVDQAVGTAPYAEDAATLYPEESYNADASDPFPAPAAALTLALPSGPRVQAPFLGRHYFDALSSPTIDLSGARPALFFSGAKTGDVAAPAASDPGLLDTKAVDWLELADNGRGLSVGVSNVYRVVTAGGGAQACSVSGATEAGEVFSVPYAAQYWIYG
ncbi:hypothetical protein BD289DRAFT_448893 [Coniella lustricola]|uniref:Malate dehydrogenase n=1 Tax=Coniella lustricola TaxID=2025994 RepID=A0A2T2ZRT1_9PEZI|nr:hypothetical protein BD289DRAFT_448893 [Coniella lustricola]